MPVEAPPKKEPIVTVPYPAESLRRYLETTDAQHQLIDMGTIIQKHPGLFDICVAACNGFAQEAVSVIVLPTAGVIGDKIKIGLLECIARGVFMTGVISGYKLRQAEEELNDE